MSTGEQEQVNPAAESQTGEKSLLEQAIDLTQTTKPDRPKELVSALVEEVLKGTTTVGQDVVRTVNKAIDHIDEVMSKQLSAVLHNEAFQKLEGSWRGLSHLVMNSETGTTLKIRVLNVSKKELFKDVDRAIEFDQSQIFKKVYSEEFDQAGGAPYGALIGDYEFENHPQDISLLEKMSNVAAAGFCPFLSAASSKMFQMNSFSQLGKTRDLAKIFDTVEYTQWKSYRDTEDSRFVVLTCPRTLSRLPYGSGTSPVDEFNYEEVELTSSGDSKVVPHDQYAWMNTSYVLGTQLTNAFSKTGFCTAIRGAENGGMVEGLPAHIFETDDGDKDLKCPTEVAITERREYELSGLGFLPLVHYKETDYAVFFGAETTQKPKIYTTDDATANSRLSARLPYIMAMSRFSHYLKVMARDWIGSFAEKEDLAKDLQKWIMGYVSADENPGPAAKAKFPLREAQITVKEDPANPGSYSAIIDMRPWLQLEQLSASMRMVARIPERK